jgi:hypothetical protein
MYWEFITIEQATIPHANEVYPRPANDCTLVCANEWRYQFTRVAKHNLNGGVLKEPSMSL